jgi:hypothetical protein
MDYKLLIIGLAMSTFGWWLMIGGAHQGWLESRLDKCQEDILNLGPIDNPIAKSELKKQLSIEHGLLLLSTILKHLTHKPKNQK